MKFFILIGLTSCLALGLVTQAKALPAEDAHAVHFMDGVGAFKAMEPELHDRFKRGVCDFLIGSGSNHAACAAQCSLTGNRGGYCNGRGVCVCRK